MKILVAAVLSVALIWLAPNTHNFNNSEQEAAAITQRRPVSTPKATDPAQTVKQEETPAPQIAPAQPQTAPAAVEPIPSTHEGLMAAAGISPADYGAVDYIVSHESSWNQQATEPTTQAHGLVQALPFSKTGCSWDDAVCTLRWGQEYAVARYGGWWPAQAYWSVHRNW